MFVWPQVLEMGESADPECIKQVFIVGGWLHSLPYVISGAQVMSSKCIFCTIIISFISSPSLFPDVLQCCEARVGWKNTTENAHPRKWVCPVKLSVCMSPLCVGNWQEELQKYINPDQLPQAYGGTRCEPDPWCSDHVSVIALSCVYSWVYIHCLPVCSSTLAVTYLPSTIWPIRQRLRERRWTGWLWGEGGHTKWRWMYLWWEALWSGRWSLLVLTSVLESTSKLIGGMAKHRNRKWYIIIIV